MRVRRGSSCLIILLILALLFVLAAHKMMGIARDFWSNYMNQKASKIADMDSEDIVSGGAICGKQIRKTLTARS